MQLRVEFGLVAVLFAVAGHARAAEAVDFNRDVKPILAKNCFACHGPDDGQRKAGLRLDRREIATKVRKRGTAIMPGKPDESVVIERIATDDEADRMPPAETGNRLTAEQIATLKRWVQQGAPYAEHWSFVKPKRSELPTVKNRTWPKNAIDYFILDRIVKAGLQPAAEADRFVLLRRASVDLRGLPPSIEEIDAFAKDTSPAAYEKMVDRFLKDSAYGERWARMWLDLARYADSAGYGSDPLRTNMWRYRDWVIDAFNKNKPYDRFTIEQLAGDLLPNPTLDQRMATAFHRNTMTNTEGGTDDEEFRVAAVKDRVDTTLLVWMGLTMGCAKCHDHKFDPIKQREYYGFFAIFNQTADADRPDETPVIDAPTPEISEKLRKIDEQIAAARNRLSHPDARDVASWAAQRTIVPSYALASLNEIGRLQKSRPQVPTLPVMQELPTKQHRKTHVMIKGNFLDPGEEVKPGTPAGLFPFPKGAAPDRLGVAKWLVHADNPLTARVAVNRYWAQLFGRGLVETEEDFGTQGALPTHPELLDWLATEYIRLGWDTKALLKLIVTSATYRQTSRVTPQMLKADPKNLLCTRAPRFRLEAEMVRDQALALSGLLSRKVGGPSVYPPQPPGLWQAAFNGQRTWPTSTGEDKHRRGMYTFWRRTIPYPSMTAFDAPSRETCAIKRVRTNTPLQAFVTLNDPVYVEAAQALARRIMKEGGATPDDRATFGLRLCLSRPPSAKQLEPLVELYRSELARFEKDAKAAKAMATEPIGAVPQGINEAQLAAWTVVANVLLNLDGVLTKG